MIQLSHVLTLGAVIFSIGVYGLLVRRNAVSMLISIEVMMNAAILNFVAFSRWVTPNLLTGEIFAIFIIGVTAAKLAVGLAIVLTIFRNIKSVDVSQVDLMKW